MRSYNLQQLNIFYEWCGTWKMQVNDSKTNFVHFWNRGRLLQVVKVYKYLGLLFDEFVTFDGDVKVLIQPEELLVWW